MKERSKAPTRVVFRGTNILVGDFSRDRELRDMNALAVALLDDRYKTTVQLTLDFMECTQLSDVSSIGASLASLEALQ
jgi:hypothetical protein